MFKVSVSFEVQLVCLTMMTAANWSSESLRHGVFSLSTILKLIYSEAGLEKVSVQL